MSDAQERSLVFNPIGYVRTASRTKFDAPSQPDETADEVNFVDLLPGQQFELALQDLDGFDKIWIVSWFDRNQHWRPRVLPPRGPSKRRGVFATRSPHRPNPIGLTCVSLLAVEGLVLKVGPLDLTDGTPILDIKPYLRTVDSHPTSSLGWIEPIEASSALPPGYSIAVSERAEVQLAWLRDNWNINFTERAFQILQCDPTPHRTRRILQIDADLFRISCGAWRMYFRVKGQIVLIEDITKGYSDENLALPRNAAMLDREAQIAFAAHFGKNM